MTKYSWEHKLEAVIAYLESNDSFKTIAKRFGVGLTPLKSWVALYKEHGAVAFKSSYTSYDLHYKMDVLNYMNDFGVTANQAAAIFNISSPSTVHKWEQLLKESGIGALKSNKKGRPTMKKENDKTTKKPAQVEGSVEALQAEIAHLRMENAYLKKLNALVQNKEKSPNKTKHK
jgi:transposase